MKTIQGPAIYLAQFIGDAAPFNSLDAICGWAASLGYEGVQLPTWDKRLFDLERAASSKGYCDLVQATASGHGVVITELSTHLQGQLVAVHPAYDDGFDAFAPPEVRHNPKARQEWAVQQMLWSAKAGRNLGHTAQVTFSGALAYPYLYPWPPRPKGLIDTAFTELAKRWRPILDACDEQGVDICYEIHPGEDLLDGASFERFLGKVDNHPRCCINYDPSHFVLQALDYLQFIDVYHERIKAFHVKDAELNPTGRQGVYGGFGDGGERARGLRPPRDGGGDLSAVFSKLTQYGYGSWAVVEWECCIKDAEQGARESAELVRSHLIRVTERNFEDYTGGAPDESVNRRALGLDR